MQPVSANFGFLKRHGEPLFNLAVLAEHYFRTDPNTCLYKLRHFGELMAKDIAARAGLPNGREQTQAALIGAIGRGGYAKRFQSARYRAAPLCIS